MALFLSGSLDPPSNSIAIQDALAALPDLHHHEPERRCVETAHLMHRMAGEIDFVLGHITRLLDRGAHFAIDDGYRDTSLLLDPVPGFAVRLNKWKPQARADADTLNGFGLAYNVPHNHDFQLVTKGIFGDGYETDIYRFASEANACAFGQDVQLDHQGRFRLSTGSVIWFEQFRDVHIQFPPQRFSMSLNFIPLDVPIEKGQYFFDVDAGKIDGFARSRFARVLTLIDVMTDFTRDDEALSITTGIAKATQNRWLKLALSHLVADKWNKSAEEAFDSVELPASLRALEGADGDFSPAHVR